MECMKQSFTSAWTGVNQVYLYPLSVSDLYIFSLSVNKVFRRSLFLTIWVPSPCKMSRRSASTTEEFGTPQVEGWWMDASS